MKKKTLSLVAMALVFVAAVPGPPSTPYTRGLMQTTNSAEARTYLGVSSGGTSGSGTANQVAKFLSASVVTNALMADDGINAWTTGTGAFAVPSGTTAQQPTSPTNGMARYNTTTSRMEFYSGGAWRSVSVLTNALGIYRDQSIEAGAMFAGPTAATASTYTNLVNDTLSDSWTFADAATQSARFSLTLPDAWNVGTIKLKLYVTCDGTNTATTTNLVWGVKAGSLAPLESLTNAVFGTQVFVTNGLNTAGNVMQVFTTGAITVGGSPAMGDSIWVDISRQGSNASDDWTNTPVRLLKARVQWLEGTAIPAVW
jgi:hypothetical protein